MRARPERARYIALYARVAREGVRSRMRDVSVSLSHPLRSEQESFSFFSFLASWLQRLLPLRPRLFKATSSRPC